MEQTRLTGKEWLDSQGVAYQIIPVNPTARLNELPELLKCKSEQVLVSDLYIGTRAPIIVVHAVPYQVDLVALGKHVGDTIERMGTTVECVKETGLSLEELHPFLENYLWKVLDERMFENETIYIRAGKREEVLVIEANALKYVIGVVNGLLAEVTIK